MIELQKINNNFCITEIYTCFNKFFESGYHFRGETHNFWELVCVVEGEIKAIADHRVFILKQGEAILHNPMQFHSISCFSSSGARVAFFSFLGENIPPLQNKVCEVYDINEVVKVCDLAHKYYNFRDKIYVGECKKEDHSNLMFIKRLEFLLSSLSVDEEKPFELLTHGDCNYMRIAKVLNSHITEKLSVEDIAALCNMSVSTLQKTFFKYTGMGVKRYFNYLKIQYAGVKLRKGSSIKEVASKVGFEDPNYFSTVFKRVTGCSPTKGRNYDFRTFVK